MKKKISTYLKLFVFTTATIHFINEFISASAELLDKLDHTKGKHKYNWRFGNIFYTKKGEGTPILLIHDLLPGGSGYEWNRIEDDLTKSHTVYTIDLLGCGRSDKPAITYTNFLYVQMITDFIKHVIKEKTEVMTSGYSGSLAVMAALYNKEVIHSITMINPTDPGHLSKIPGQKEHFVRKLLELPVFGTLLYYIATCKANVDNDFTENYYYNPFHIDRDVMDAYYEAAHKGGSNGKFLYASYVTRYTSFNILPALAQMGIPVHLIFGNAESNKEKIEEKYCNFLKNVDVNYVSKSKHFPHIENTAEFLKLLQ